MVKNSDSQNNDHIIVINELVSVDVVCRYLIIKERSEQRLSQSQLNLLLFLNKHSESVALRKELCREGWDGWPVTSGNLNVTISKLRKFLHDTGVVIKTVPGVGYVLYK